MLEGCRTLRAVEKGNEAAHTAVGYRPYSIELKVGQRTNTVASGMSMSPMIRVMRSGSDPIAGSFQQRIGSASSPGLPVLYLQRHC
jgi:hypothetical protein